MRACRVHAYGGPEALLIEDIPLPEPGPGEIRVRVRAAGVGPWDAWVRSGKSVVPQPLPLTPGADLAGEVDALGEGVAGFAPGDSVFGATNARFTNAYAEYALADAGRLSPKPEKLSDADAAATPVVAVTAWQALFEEAKLKRGDSVLIHGAAGSVGAFAVQLAHFAGLRIWATAGARDIPFVKSLGADEAIDFRAERFENRANGLDAVIDLVGGETQLRSFAVLKPGGALVSAVSAPDQTVAAQKAIRAGFFLVDVTAQRLQRIAELQDNGRLTVDVGTVMPLNSVKEAHEMLDGLRPRPRGKIVLSMAGASG